MNDWRQNMDPEMRLIFSNLENEVGRIKDALVGAQSRLMVECVFWRISTVIGIFTQTQVPAEVWQKAWRLYEVADWARQIVDRTWIGDNAEYQQCLDWFEDHGQL